jgi:hypothetical protein
MMRAAASAAGSEMALVGVTVLTPSTVKVAPSRLDGLT